MKKTILILLFVSISLFSKNNMTQKNILVLHSYNRSMSWEINIDKAIDDTLQPNKNNYIMYREYMDTKRIYTKKYLKDLKKLYKIKYHNVKFDLILASDNNAFDFLRKNRDKLFGNIPVSFCGVNYFKDSDLDGLTNYTGAAEIFNAKRTVKVALKLDSNIKNIYIVNDYTTTGKAWSKTIKEQLQDIHKNIIYLKNSSIEELKTKLKSLNKKDSMVLLGVYFKDKFGKYFTYEKIGKIIAQSSNAPVFCLLKFNIGKGVVGGSVISGYFQGEAMSKIAKKILNGTPPKDIHVQKNGTTRLVFDYNALVKYGMDMKNIPKDAIILNKKLSFFEKYKITIIISLIIVIIAMTIIVLLLTIIRQRKKAQIVLEESQKEIEEINKNLENKIKNRTQELENKNKEFESILDITMEGIAITNDRKFINFNDAILEMFGYSDKKEVLKKNTFDFIEPSYHPLILEKMKLDQNEPYELMGIKKDGTIFPILLKGHFISTSNRTIRVVAVFDMTKIKENEAQLKLAKEKAEESTKLKSEFLANMSHEIRTPMNGIIGMSYLALQTDLNNKQKNYIQKIDDNAKNLLGIINDILDFSKMEAGKLVIEKVEFNLFKTIDNVINLLELKADEKGLKITVNYSFDMNKNFYGDRLRISQILTNLLSNAVKFTDKGEVGIYISKIMQSVYRFEVRDTGIGLNKEQQNKLFQSFSQADGSITRKYGGTGLGLFISKQLVELMNGKIWVESEPNVGSKFIFEIEIEEIARGKNYDTCKDKRLLQQNINTLKGSKILLVEDNSTNQEIVLGLLENSGIAIDIANNGKEAIELYKTNPSKYELILMDIQMPIMDGITATKIIRKINKKVPIIALTANAMKEDKDKTKQAGMNGHLNKPIEVEKLYATLLKYISKKIDYDRKMKEKTEDITMPNFINIDMKVGLSHMAGNKKLYLKILNDFYINYKDLKLENLKNEELTRLFHTIKGLGANIGATTLSDIASKLEVTQDSGLYPKFYEKLNNVLDELKDLKIEIKTEDKSQLGKELRDELFANLKKFASKRRVRRCNEMIEKLNSYKLTSKDKELLSEIRIFMKERKYKNIVEII